MHTSACRLGLVLLVISGAARVSSGKDVAVGDGWDSTEGVPEWVAAPPQVPSAFRFVEASQSDGLALASGFSAEYAQRQMAREIVRRLRPLLAEDADSILGAVPARPTRLRKAYHLTPPASGDMSPGAQTYTVWAMWEVPSTAILERVPADERQAARDALALAEPADLPAWAKVKSPPAWTSKPPSTDEQISVALHFPADREDVARAQAITLGPERVASAITDRFRDLLGPEAAWEVGWMSATWRRCEARAYATGWSRATAWELWKVPVARILAAVPEARRAAAKVLLTPPPPAK